MTNPVILLGTQSNGETLPVQVDATGRLVAEGLQGPEGPEGPQGPQGPEGPEMNLPPDPYEGALLGWLGGELAWVGSPPIPIPPGVFGPITDWDPQSGLLTVAGEIPASVGNGVYLWQCNQDGTYFTASWNTSQVWSDNGDSLTGGSWELAFNGEIPNTITTATGAYVAPGGTCELRFDPPLSGVIRVWASTGFPSGGTAAISLSDGSSVSITGGTDGAAWYDFGAKTNITTMTLGTPDNSNGTVLGAMELNGELLVDTEESLNFRVNNLMGQSLIGVPSATVDFTIGKYLKAPEQRVAPWVLYGNDPTSLIDHLRSS